MIAPIHTCSRAGATALLALALAVLVPALAEAHTGVKFEGSRMILNAPNDAPEPLVQDLRIEVDPANVTRVLIRDLAPVTNGVASFDQTAKTNCQTTPDEQQVRCPRSLFSRIEVNTFDQHDRVTITSDITQPATVNGGLGPDTLIAGGGPTTLNGGSGDDTLVSGRNRDQILGVSGNDTVSYAGRAAAVSVDLTKLTTTGQGASGENDTISNVENVLTGGGADLIKTQNGKASTVGCGGNEDKVFADGPSLDPVAADCERIVRPDDGKGPTAKVGVKSRDIDKLVISVLSSEDASVSIKTKASFPVGAAKTLRFKTTKRSLRAGKRKRIRLRIMKSRKKAIEKALRNGTKVKARIKVTLRDFYGNKTVKTKKIRLKD